MYIKNDFNHRIIVSKSEFIIYTRRIKNELEYKNFVSEIKKKHYDATHCCSAFYTKNIQRSSDDGEPAKTAGIPILNAIINEDLIECAVVVVRYFGGVKLGANGLIRTYRDVTSKTLKLAPKINEELYPLYEIKITYEYGDKVIKWLQNNAKYVKVDYGLDITVCYASKNNFQPEIENIIRQRIEIKDIGHHLIATDV
ncbi:MAG: YigZ family protein [Erysipelotrichaceae bacterium]|nr:YigZ family protein [Erysipelotrichaceae bacterium]